MSSRHWTPPGLRLAHTYRAHFATLGVISIAAWWFPVLTWFVGFYLLLDAWALGRKARGEQ